MSTLVVLAAGLGARFGGLKQLVPVGPAGEAIMDVVLTRAVAEGFERAVVVVRPEIREAVVAHLAAFHPPPPLEVVVQEPAPGRGRPLGTAHAVLACRPVVDGAFGVVNADDLYPGGALALLAEHLSTRNEHALVAFRLDRTLIGPRPVSRAVVVSDNDHLVDIQETTVVPGPASRPEPWVSMNLWGFQRSVFMALADAVAEFLTAGANGEVSLPDVVASMVRQGAAVRVLRSEERCPGITHQEDAAVVRELQR